MGNVFNPIQKHTLKSLNLIVGALVSGDLVTDELDEGHRKILLVVR